MNNFAHVLFDQKGGYWKTLCPVKVTSRETLCWLGENLYDHITPNIWSANSPDYTPLYFVWGMVE